MTTSITAFARVFMGVSLWPAVRFGTAVLLVAALVLNTILGPSAMSLAGFGDLVAGSPRTRLGVFAIWTVALLPALRLALFSKGIEYLRWLPQPTWAGPVGLGLSLLCLHGPACALLIAAGEPAYGLFFFAASAAFTALLFVPDGQRWVFALVPMGAVYLAESTLFRLGFGALLGGWSILELRRAWILAPQRSRRRARGRSMLPLFPTTAALSLYLWRREGQMLVRIVLITVLGGLGIAGLEPGPEFAESIYLVTATPFTVAVCIMLALSLERGHRDFLWLRLSLGQEAWRVEASAMSLLLAIALPCVAILSLGSASSRIFALLLGHGAFWSALCFFLAASARLGARAAMLALLLALVDVLAIAFVGAWAVAVELSLIGILLIHLPRRMPEEIAID